MQNETEKSNTLVSKSLPMKPTIFISFLFSMSKAGRYVLHCALTGIDLPQLLLASHIIPWSDNKKERLNPCNGICLSALYDRAFDQGLIGFDSNYRTVLSSHIRENEGKDYYERYFKPISGRQLTMPSMYKPDTKFLEWHMDNIFLR